MKIKIYKSVILRVILHEYGAGSLTLKEEHRLKAFENRVLSIIFGPNVEKVTGEWRRPYITRSIKYSGAQSKKKVMGGTCDKYGRQERCIQGFDEET
jgi:hypothetical protein